jgi:hypothetical protein
LAVSKVLGGKSAGISGDKMIESTLFRKQNVPRYYNLKITVEKSRFHAGIK